MIISAYISENLLNAIVNVAIVIFGVYVFSPTKERGGREKKRDK